MFASSRSEREENDGPSLDVFTRYRSLLQQLQAYKPGVSIKDIKKTSAQKLIKKLGEHCSLADLAKMETEFTANGAFSVYVGKSVFKKYFDEAVALTKLRLEMGADISRYLADDYDMKGQVELEFQSASVNGAVVIRIPAEVCRDGSFPGLSFSAANECRLKHRPRDLNLGDHVHYDLYSISNQDFKRLYDRAKLLAPPVIKPATRATVSAAAGAAPAKAFVDGVMKEEKTSMSQGKPAAPAPAPTAPVEKVPEMPIEEMPDPENFASVATALDAPPVSAEMPAKEIPDQENLDSPHYVHPLARGRLIVSPVLSRPVVAYVPTATAPSIEDEVDAADAKADAAPQESKLPQASAALADVKRESRYVARLEFFGLPDNAVGRSLVATVNMGEMVQGLAYNLRAAEITSNPVLMKYNTAYNHLLTNSLVGAASVAGGNGGRASGTSSGDYGVKLVSWFLPAPVAVAGQAVVDSSELARFNRVVFNLRVIFGNPKADLFNEVPKLLIDLTLADKASIIALPDTRHHVLSRMVHDFHMRFVGLREVVTDQYSEQALKDCKVIIAVLDRPPVPFDTIPLAERKQYLIDQVLAHKTKLDKITRQEALVPAGRPMVTAAAGTRPTLLSVAPAAVRPTVVATARPQIMAAPASAPVAPLTAVRRPTVSAAAGAPVPRPTAPASVAPLTGNMYPTIATPAAQPTPVALPATSNRPPPMAFWAASVDVAPAVLAAPAPRPSRRPVFS